MSTPFVHPSLSELADWYYSVLDLAEEADEELPQSHWASDEGVKEVLLRAFASSDCGNFAVMLHEMTHWPIVNLHGMDGTPLHSFIRTPEGDALDIHGVRSIPQLARYYGLQGKHPPLFEVPPHDACGCTLGEDMDDLGFDYEARRVAGIIRQLPWAPFCTPQFKVLS